MRLLDRLADRYRAGQGYYEGLSSGAAVLTAYGSDSNRESSLQQIVAEAQEAYATNGVVYACILTRMMLLAEARFCFQSLSDKGIYGKPELEILEKPWPGATSGEMIARAEQDVSLAGNSFMWKADSQLVRLPPDEVTIVSVVTRDSSGRRFRRVIGYDWDPTTTNLPGIGPGGGDEVAQHFTVDEVAHWCVDESTEILTAEGWKDFRSLRIGDETLTLNHATGLSEWQPVTDVCVFPDQRRELVSMEGSQHSSLTTPNHRWPVEYRISRAKTYGRRWVTSVTIGAGDRIPIAAHSADLPTEQKWADALVEIVAWFWTEGVFKSGRQPGTHGRGISIGQSFKNDANLARIRAALTSLFGPAVEQIPKRGPRADQPPCWRESADDDMAILSMSANASDVITQHAPEKVVTTEFLRSLTASQLDLFIKVSLLADNNGPARLAQKSQAMAEQFALACVLAGHGVSIRKSHRKPGSRYGGDTMWNVRIRRDRHVYPQEDKRPGSTFRVQRVDYDGHVWCPRTPNETWLARRNGSVYFTGNSPYPDPQARFRGMSWLTPVMRDVTGDSGLTAYKSAYLDHAATPNMVIQYPTKLRADTIDAIVARMAARYGGVSNAYKALVLDQGATVNPVGSTFSQLDFSAVQGVGEDRIAAAAGVDPILLGLLTIGRSAVGYPDAMRKLADLTCRPLWRTMCAAWEKLVPYKVPQGHRLWFDLSDVAALRQGEMERAQATQVKAAALVTMVQAGYTRESAVKAVSGDDISLLVEAPQPAPAAAAPSGGQPGVPRGPAGVTQVQTPASKLPSPSSFANLPSVNGNGASGG